MGRCAAAALRHRFGGQRVGDRRELLGEHRLAEDSLRVHVVGDLGVQQRFPAAALGHIHREQLIVGADANLPPQHLFAIGAAMDRHLGRERVGRHLPGRPPHEDPVLARECLRGHVSFVLGRVIGIDGRVVITQQHASRRRPRCGEGADRAGRFLDDHVDVRVTRPGEIDHEIADQRRIDRSLEAHGSVRAALLLEGVDRGFGEAGGPCHHLLLPRGPFVGEHAGAGPGEGFDVVRSRGHRHRQRVGLAAGRIDSGDGAAEPQGLLVGPKPGQVVGQLHQIDGARGEVGSREQDPLHVCPRTARGFHGQGQRFVHPGLAMTAGDRRREQVGRLVK